MTQEQKNILEAFEAGDLGQVEFFELALDAGLSLDRIEEALQEANDF